MISYLVNNKNMIVYPIFDSHAIIFYPMSYFNLNIVNQVLSENVKYNSLSYHWVTIQSIKDSE